ncbi:MAG: hypothetical protein [Enterobacter phage ENC9]|nr:MAG: hypothetical protein [Enterobacter phage ENC9]
MRSFIRVNGKEAYVEDVRPIDMAFNEKVVSELRKVFGEKAQFNIRPVANFANEEHTDNIFSGIITGQFESEAPVAIEVFIDIESFDTFNSADELPEPDITIPAFLGFRK